MNIMYEIVRKEAMGALADIWKDDIAKLKRDKPPGWRAACSQIERAMRDVKYVYKNLDGFVLREVFDGLTDEPEPDCPGENQIMRRAERYAKAKGFAAALAFAEGDASLVSDVLCSDRYLYIMSALGYEDPIWEPEGTIIRLGGVQ